jgi:hypothetical protein
MIFSTSSPEGRINLAVMDSFTKERDIVGIPSAAGQGRVF